MGRRQIKGMYRERTVFNRREKEKGTNEIIRAKECTEKKDSVQSLRERETNE